jgi:lysophospholipase L1-like esterase
MTNKSYPLLGSLPFSALVFAAACGLSACAADEGDNNPQLPPGFTQDGAAVVMGNGDAGTVQPPVITTPDASTVIPRLDAGVTPPVVTGDTGVVVPMGDSGVVVPTGDAAAPDAAVTMRPDQGMGDGKDVITIGDSWMNLDNSIGIQQSLEKISKRDYRNFGVPGTRLLDEVIPNQYEMALREGAIKTVIMTGGGNDIIQDKLIFQILSGASCADENFTAECTMQLDAIAARLAKLWAKMAQDGVQDVIIVGYTKTAKPLGYNVSKSAEYSNMKIPPICAAVPLPLRCHVFDADVEVPSIALQADGIHPNAASYDALGAAVWKLMQAKGMRR